jgi:hypothetical protein
VHRDAGDPPGEEAFPIGSLLNADRRLSDPARWAGMFDL